MNSSVFLRLIALGVMGAETSPLKKSLYRNFLKPHDPMSLLESAMNLWGCGGLRNS